MTTHINSISITLYRGSLFRPNFLLSPDAEEWQIGILKS